MDQPRENDNGHIGDGLVSDPNSQNNTPGISQSLSHHSVLNLANPFLVGLIQIKAAGNQPSVFETHTALVWMSVSAMLAYIIVSFNQQHFPHLSPPLQLMSKFFASTSITLLVFILFPPLKWELLASYFVSLFLLTIWLLIKLFIYVSNSRKNPTPILPITTQNPHLRSSYQI